MKHNLSKKEIKELRESKKKIAKYALKEFKNKLGLDQEDKAEDTAKILRRIEAKLDNILFFLEKPSTLDIKGYWGKQDV
jgi:DNA-binding ferritin-like protein